MPETIFPDYKVAEPDLAATTERYDSLNLRLDSATDADSVVAVVREWDELLKELNEWYSVTLIRFQQDTNDPVAKAANDQMDSDWPLYIDLATKMKRKLALSPWQSAISAATAPALMGLWDCDARAFDTVITDDQGMEAKLSSEYTALTAGAKIEFEGDTLTLSQLDAHSEAPDRQKRYAAVRATSDWFFTNAESLDRIYGDQVNVRHSMARKLGFENFVELGYQRMRRVGYGAEEVAAFRAEILREVVPLAVELSQLQAKALGIGKTQYWDEGVHSLHGNPKPLGDHDWMIERAGEMFRQMGHGLDSFFDLMKQRQTMDLKSREGKAPGGFCDFLPKFGCPFIFANFNGTRGDVDVFTHEMGHAFQAYSSRKQPFSELVWPTTEACEIHSMGLEFLTWPQMDLFYGADAADELRRVHLTGSLMFMPYGVSIDAFQHDVYANPDATHEERNAMWQAIEQTYLPWYDYGDLPCERSGRLWQQKRHVYDCPFYYIDYVLALTCALQFWRWSRNAPREALSAYAGLCQRGGSLPFAELVESAGLVSPFADGCLKEVIADAREFLLGDGIAPR
ncbi:MAG: M3 family oligoendopeptidase [Verrucomicrobiae bacterium]|nr:M3 family oligoendopeptidase [Verrucomicrobiae bacterium]